MSINQDEERKDYVERGVTPTVSATVPETENTVIQRQPIAQIPAASPPPIEKRESVVRRSETNTGALIAIIIGAIILIFGLYLVFSQMKFFPAPWSYIIVLIVGLILIGVGAKLVSSKATVASI
ncbi:MAG: hypothetical protein ACREBS_07985 [Nitrososphaerales archaeon]